MSHLSVQGLTKVFETVTGPLRVLDDISFSVAEASSFACSDRPEQESR